MESKIGFQRETPGAFENTNNGPIHDLNSEENRDQIERKQGQIQEDLRYPIGPFSEVKLAK